MFFVVVERKAYLIGSLASSEDWSDYGYDGSKIKQYIMSF